MRIARYWAKAPGPSVDRDGKRYRLELWGWSSSSPADALNQARERVRVLAERFARGERLDRYAYGIHPNREELAGELGVPDTPSHAFISRNRVGALVPNTAELPFIDVDFPTTSGLSNFVRRIRGQEPPEQATLAQIRRAAKDHPQISFRVYRTAAGYRVLVTNLFLDPTGSEAKGLLEAFGADPRFVVLCRVQGSFRARLTPKPWRVDCPPSPGRYPRDEASLRQEFAAWLEQYEAAIREHATCRLVCSLGPARFLDEAREVIEAHDSMTRATVDLPLA
jgi:hypothetical protein